MKRPSLRDSLGLGIIKINKIRFGFGAWPSES